MTPLLRPREGIPLVAHTPAQFEQAARQLAAGRGPFAIDTERASDFRFDDRAFLVQIRRQDSGTVLIAPESDRNAATRALAPVLNDREWILHAAASDLPSLSLLGLHPTKIFDTELSGRLLGFPKVNLAAIVEQVLSLELEKNHGNEDWSRWPLPDSWLIYAALDVEVLLELAEALTELLDSAGKLEWLEEECTYILTHAAHSNPQWRDLKGIGRLKNRQQLYVAQTLWERRQCVAARRDKAAHKILPNRLLVELAASMPQTPAAVKKVLGRRANAALVAKVTKIMQQATSAGPEAWPEPKSRDYNVEPAPRAQWSQSYPEAQEALDDARVELAELAEELGTPAENLLQPAMLRQIIWHSTITGKITNSAKLNAYMTELQVRPWQRELMLPLLGDVLF